MAQIGICALCLEERELTFEHIPPRRAFNNRPAVAHTVYGLTLASTIKRDPPLLKRPRGLGQHALCTLCNGQTAALYGDAFADWTFQCLSYADRIQGPTRIILSFSIYPLRVLKQIVVMLLAASKSTADAPLLRALRYFVRNPHSISLPKEFVISGYLNPQDPARMDNPLLTQNRLSGSCGVIDTKCGSSVFVLSEVAFPPMGYVGFSSTPDHGRKLSDNFASLLDFRWFSNYPYNRRTTMHIRMPVRFPFGPVPGYYPDLNRPDGVPYLGDNQVLLTNT